MITTQHLIWFATGFAVFMISLALVEWRDARRYTRRLDGIRAAEIERRKRKNQPE